MRACGRWLLLGLLVLPVACQREKETAEIPATGPVATATSPATALAPTATSPAPDTPTDQAANADVTFVRAVQTGDGSWTFHVTVAHPDTGWEDYADGWDVVTPAGEVVKQAPEDTFTRLLLHPHVGEQPFTRSQGGLTLPSGVAQVTVRAHDLLAGFGGQEVVVDLASASGPGFEVAREEE